MIENEIRINVIKKICKKCNQNLLLINFYPNKNMKDGYFDYCKNCDKKRNNLLREKNKNKNENRNIFDKTMKKCSSCGKTKERSKENWFTTISNKDGLCNYCKDCKTNKNKISVNNRIKRNQKRNPYNKTIKYCSHCRKRKERNSDNWGKSLYTGDGLNDICKICRSFQAKKRKYNISAENYNKLLKSQNNRCKICGSSLKKNINIDHDHKTGEIRGILCNNCNRALGYFKDNPMILYNAIKYLRYI